MMKKILAMLLALLLLPAAALAEPMCFEVTMAADEANLTEVLKASGLFAGDSEDTLCAIAAEVINGTGLRVVSQENGGQLELLISGDAVLDLQLILDSAQVVITSTLMKGAGFSIPTADVEAAGTELANLVERLDPFVIMEAVMAMQAELDTIDITSARGSYSGHAYTGGVYCDTCVIDDAKIAAILNALLTDDIRAMILDLCEAIGEDGAALLAQLDAKNARVMAENPYQYILRLVSDAQQQPIGFSVAILQGDRQLATLSLGWNEQNLRLVAAFAMEDANYWHSHEIGYRVTEAENGTMQISLEGAMIEFTAPKDEDYPYAMAVSGVETLQSVWSLDVTSGADRLAWDYLNHQRYGETAPVERISWTGLSVPDEGMISEASFSLDEKEYLTLNMSCKPCEALKLDASSLNLCSLVGGDEGLVFEIAYSFGNEIAMRLLKVLPMQLLMLLQ